jgi:exopolyphosphatase / guanosine-5'-triphosphate,3'-diphosphate pyrophosphatase
VYVRYGGEPDIPAIDSILAMLDEDVREHWRMVGLALRLAYALSGATPAILRRSAVAVADGRLNLRLPKGHDALLGEAVERRLQALATALGKSAAVVVGSERRRSS